MSVFAGQLQHRVTLQQRATTLDAAGQQALTWSDVATVWADIRYVSGLEAVKSDAPVSVSRASIRIRWRSGVTAAMRVLYGSRVFDINAVLPDDGDATYLELACETGANQG